MRKREGEEELETWLESGAQPASGKEVGADDPTVPF